ncbi:uncharacterized protein LOC116118693 [Pistacia vera]|uniref:uncharacterized protein LOC116118693 n=1 Tax=Pistacia vera TaxID=55513 RepID=UPI001263CE09|nr:uncharacterized protein LOC116118693 [Pistacia vera]
MNNCLVVYIEKEVFATIENEDIIEHFQNISKRKIVLNEDSDKGKQSGGDSFVLAGFRNWKRLENFKYHIGGPNSYHNQTVKNCQDLVNQKQHLWQKRIQILRDFFLKVSCVINIVGWSPRRRDLLNEKQALKVKKAIKSGELSTGQGLNQDTSLKRLGETWWGSHYKTLLSLINLFSSVIEVLEDLTENSDNRVEASDLVDYMTSFDFAFNLHMMKNILGITFEHSQALQRKDQDIINDMSLRSQRNVQEMTNLFHYRVELFYAIIDLQLSELNNRFNEGNTKLLICMASLNPSDCFQAFDKGKLVGFAQFYPLEFSSTDLMALELQLDNYIDDMRSNSDFSKLNDIIILAQKMVEKKKHLIYSLVYLFITLYQLQL